MFPGDITTLSAEDFRNFHDKDVIVFYCKALLNGGELKRFCGDHGVDVRDINAKVRKLRLMGVQLPSIRSYKVNIKNGRPKHSKAEQLNNYLKEYLGQEKCQEWGVE